MKKAITEFIKQRYILHFFVAIALAFISLGFLTERMHFADFQFDFEINNPNKFQQGVLFTVNHFLQFVLIGGYCWAAGFAYEWLQGVILKAKWSWWDVRWSGIGGFVGGIIYYAYPNNRIIFYLALATIAFFGGRELIRGYKLKKGKK